MFIKGFYLFIVMIRQDIITALEEQDKRRIGKVIDRELFLKLKEELSSPFIVTLSGIRRCGKSTIFLQLKHGNAYYVDFDDERFVNFNVDDFQKLYEMLFELFGQRDFFIFDEIQNIKGWERFVRRLYSEGKKIFVTGSNASLLSRELGTHLTGRTTEYQLYPFSFKEFLKLKNNFNEVKTSEQRGMIKKLFSEYLKTGGFPDYITTKNEVYLSSLYNNILYRDIIVRYKLPSETTIKQTSYYALSNIAKEISYNGIRKLVNLTSATTVKEYFNYFENCYLFFILSKYDFSLKKQQYSSKKVYCIDNGLAVHLGFSFSENKGRLLENLVFIELKRQGKEIYYHKNKYKCDFVVKKGIRIIEAIQVCYELNKDNKKREFNGLLEAMKEHKLKEGLLLTYDQDEIIELEGKRIVLKPVWKWLLE